ncbi:MAG: hypothetical protein MUQ10_09985 [Anaerolineae bacterium]|nr:hypothetical protein [Anaerolineae bacterium]
MTSSTVQSTAMQQSKRLDRDNMSVLIAILLLGNLLFRFIELPEQRWRFRVFGSPLDIHLTGVELLVVLMVGLVCTGTNLIFHGRAQQETRPIYISWILPGIVAGMCTLALSRVALLPVWIVGLFLMGFIIAATIVSEYRASSLDAPSYPGARLTLNVLAYFLAFALFGLVYQTRSRSIISATATALTAALLSLDLLSVADVPITRVLIFTGVVGLIVGESTWALNYWQVNSWIGGVLLLLVFYVATNVAYQHLLGKLTVLTVVEFAAVASVVFVVVLLVSP